MAWDIEQVKKEIRGPAALVMAPFNEDYSLNVDALKNNIRYILEGGLKTGQGFMICPCGSGEYLTLTPEEHLAMVKAALEAAEDDLPLVVGVGGIDIRQVIDLLKAARKAGARYAMIAPPFYDSIDQDTIFEWYRTLNNAVDIGIMIYDQSWRGALGTSISVPLMKRLADLENVVSLKYGGPTLFEEMIVALECFSDRFAFLENSLAYTGVVAHIHGGTAFVSGPSNWWPEFEVKYFHLMEEGKYAEADRMHARLAPYMALAHGEFWESKKFFLAAAKIKASMEYVGLYGGPVRPPFRSMNEQEKRELFAIMKHMDVKPNGENFVGWDFSKGPGPNILVPEVSEAYF